MRTVAAPGFAGWIGVARRDVTPPPGIAQNAWGPATERRSTGVHRPLTLTALALRDGADAAPLVLVALDGSWWRAREDEWHVREAVLAAAGGDEARAIVTLSHSHSAPLLTRDARDFPGGELVAPYLDALRIAAAEATRDALAATVPATLTWSTGRSAVAGARDLTVDGRPLIGWNPDAEADDTLLAGRVTAADGTVLATLVNYACHPTTLAWQNTLTSPDYVGALRETVEDATGGAPCLFLLGAAGELAPRDQYTGDVAVADRHGRAVGHAALAALEQLPPPGVALALHPAVESGAPLAPWWPVEHAWPDRLATTVEAFDMPLKPQPTVAELEQRWAEIDPLSRAERLRRAALMRETFGDGPAVPWRVWVWQLGGALVVAQSGEAYSLFQRELRRRFPDRAVVVLNLANWSGPAYLPPRELYARDDAYTVWQTPLAAGCLETAIEAAAAGAARLTDEETVR
ncbi:hypothetical protein [Conexibacter woesei]|uniref:Neutral/alkaline non-lysosomal ceramidase N-terminal domain-containing protein n=1 Tax=Conexibacter woesei (strain DSM 14684 / CCUG 47730 / CIP 108061 / JCM 11494 / NBRC 100937 / ID131577) TaxID=469383 RepID=D3F4X7_CONWI|nr:hypothetical protein [Conexibacter woesei]ADB48555.1 hypothetical protein Cwoe_0119 [Conexibacter woesei DSM 14684]